MSTEGLPERVSTGYKIKDVAGRSGFTRWADESFCRRSARRSVHIWVTICPWLVGKYLFNSTTTSSTISTNWPRPLVRAARNSSGAAPKLSSTPKTPLLPIATSSRHTADSQQNPLFCDPPLALRLARRRSGSSQRDLLGRPWTARRPTTRLCPHPRRRSHSAHCGHVRTNHPNRPRYPLRGPGWTGRGPPRTVGHQLRQHRHCARRCT